MIDFTIVRLESGFYTVVSREKSFLNKGDSIICVVPNADIGCLLHLVDKLNENLPIVLIKIDSNADNLKTPDNQRLAKSDIPPLILKKNSVPRDRPHTQKLNFD